MFVIAAIVLPVLITMFGGVLEYGMLIKMRAQLQNAADTAALATAKEMTVSSADSDSLKMVAESMVLENLKNMSRTMSTGRAVVDTSFKDDERTVIVQVKHPVDNLFPLDLILPEYIGVAAQAKIISDSKLCVLSLEPKEEQGLSFEDNARLTGYNCSAYANSKHKRAIFAGPGALVTTDVTCSAGGIDGHSSSFDPVMVTDCPKISDPLASRQAPSVGSCIETDLTIENDVRTLRPGTYCGGIQISGDSRVTLEPGIYVIKNGELSVDGTSELIGEYVGFYFTGKYKSRSYDKIFDKIKKVKGDRGRLAFFPDTTIDLSAPKNGVMAGLLFYQDPDQDKKSSFWIYSTNARNLVGTIYLPNGSLVIDSYGTVADESAYTAIIVKRLRLQAGPHLVLNTDYNETDIPVPDGVKNLAGEIALVK
jgi:hypothetical protein